jgi:MoxR-like ATPase
VSDALRQVGYLPDHKTATVVHLAGCLGKPVLVEGPVGTGKTELAKSVAAVTGPSVSETLAPESWEQA